MTLDLRTRNFKVMLRYANGTNAIDVSPLVESFVVSNSGLDESGLMESSGTLSLAAFPLAGWSESLNPKFNAARFARRSQVEVWIEDEFGNLEHHPRGRLRILKSPKPATRTTPTLDIEVGCLLSLLDYKQPPGDDSKIEPGVSRTRTEIINSLATAIGLPGLEDEIPEWEIDYPLPRLSGSVVRQMGQVAFAAGYVLWIDKEEKLRATRIPRHPSAALTLRLGVDDAFFEELSGQETPCEKVYVTCTYPKAIKVKDPPTTRSLARTTEYSIADLSAQSWTGMGTARVQSYRESFRPKGLVLPNDHPNNRILTPAEQEWTTSTFAEDEAGFLQKRERIVKQPQGVILPGFFPGSLILTIALIEEQYFSYRKSVLEKITTYVFEPQGVVNPAAEGAGQLTLARSSIEVQQWQKVNDGWTKTVLTQDFKRGSSPRSSTSFSGSQNTPPAPEQRQPPYYLEDTQVTGKVKLAKVIGLTADERGRTFTVETASNKEQLNYLAGLIGQRLWGQEHGVSFGLDLRDAVHVHYHPLQAVDWVEFDETTGERIKSRYLAIRETWALTDRQCVYAADGLNLGRVRRRKLDGSTPSDPVEPPAPDEVEELNPPYQELGASEGILELIGGFTLFTEPLIPVAESFAGTIAVIGVLAQEPLRGVLEVVGGISEQEPIEPGLLHWWKLDSATWEDSVGGVTLTPQTNAGIFDLVVEDGFTRFTGSSWLSTTNTAIQSIIESGVWRISAEIWLSQEYNGIMGANALGGAPTQWATSYYSETSEAVYFTVQTTTGFETVESSAAITLETWIAIEFEMSLTQLIIRVNGLEDAIAYSGTIIPVTNWEFTIGFGPGMGVTRNESRMRNVKLYGA